MKAELRLLERVQLCNSNILHRFARCRLYDFRILFCRFRDSGVLNSVFKDMRGCRPECNWIIKQEMG